jgi:uncharacterized damage-inducible protein DinB
MLGEFQREAETTRQVLERVPGDKLTWAPHPKSMTLGQLALHVATIPGNVTQGLAAVNEFDVAGAKFEAPSPESKEALLAAFEASMKAGADYLEALTPEAANESWRLTLRGHEVFTMPRAGMLRMIMLNHWYHHRGQLSVYLRMLDVPVPAIYGRSADENPFA